MARSGEKQTLKGQNRTYLVAYLTLHVVVFLIVAKIANISLKDMDAFYQKINDPKSWLFIFSFPLSIALEGVISSHVKAVLVFWRLRNPLPGCRAFSEVAVSDPRVDVGSLRSLLGGTLPEDASEQNQKWYELYRKYGNASVVIDAHRAFLLTRDLAAMTVILIPIVAFGHRFWGTAWTALGYHSLFLFSCYIVCSLASRNYGKRFIANVLVEAIFAQDPQRLTT